ncbi:MULTISPECIES: histidine kinase [unclassified Microbacterium]|uniref:histidine kinase n=1 Tax=unclassified Microbacterium TaxID=2609290 RepID=UPI00214C5490|nr:MULTISPECIES: histidine kinase [unclassified Microbacterium]MCR2785264.1 histidine kinase [Microbacterium sp. zg.B96]MDL5352626.1 histidine kinase [Microbacterium sp. zg-YB36]WIM16794.1 histidine kinase [Microbacterium sp. zg-B96]
MPTTPAPTPIARLGGALLALEALGVAALVGWQVVALAGGDTGSMSSAIALMVLTAVTAVAVAAFSVAVFRGQSWGRSGGIVVQLLLLAVALGAVTGTFADPTVALLLAGPALLTLVLLVLGVREAAPRSEDRDAA